MKSVLLEEVERSEHHVVDLFERRRRGCLFGNYSIYDLLNYALTYIPFTHMGEFLFWEFKDVENTAGYA